MGIGELRVLVDQLAGKQQVPGDDLCQVLRQAPQFRPDATVQSADVGTCRDLRLGTLRLKARREPPLELTMIIPAAIIVAPVITAAVVVAAAVAGTGVRTLPTRSLPRRSPAVEGRSTRAPVVAVVIGPIATAAVRAAAGGAVTGTRRVAAVPAASAVRTVLGITTVRVAVVAAAGTPAGSSRTRSASVAELLPIGAAPAGTGPLTLGARLAGPLTAGSSGDSAT
jgi:hypothetical protein